MCGQGSIPIRDGLAGWRAGEKTMTKLPALSTMFALTLAGIVAAIPAYPATSLRAARQLSGTSVSPSEHYFGAAGCHPHCQPGQGDRIFFQEQYSSYIDVRHVSYICRGNGHIGDPCVFDSMIYTVDTVNHVLNVTWLNRSDEVWIHLTAPIR